MALPWFESLAKAATKPPVRFATVYFSNGVEPEHWWAKGQGASMQIGPGLSPMMPHREDFTFIRGLFNKQAFISTSPHLGRAPNLLSGAKVSLDASDMRVGTSMDQVLSQRIGGQTAVPSMALGIEPNELRLEDGLSMVYGSCISWSSPTKPATKEIYPARTFDLLVGDGSGRKLDRSILDALRLETRDLQPKMNGGDRTKLGEYLESIRDIEKRIERASKDERLEGWRPTLDKPNMARPKDALPQDVPEHMKLMLDLTVLAFQMDKTRVVTLMLNNDLSQMNFKFIDGVHGALHLDLTHNQKVAAAEAMYLKTNQFHVAQFAYLVDRLKQINEGEGSLLDSSMLLFTSNLFDGDSHGADQMPVLLAGKGGGSLRPGQVLDYLEKGDDQRQACSLYLSLMDRMGVKLDRFGDASTRIMEV